MSIETYREYAEGRIAGMRTERASWMSHWAELAEFILPRRYKWLPQPNQGNRGSAINGSIVDETGTLAARTLAAGLLAGVVSPTRPWFKLKISGFQEDPEVSRWLGEGQKRMMEVFQESNFYSAMSVHIFDQVVFGTGCVLIYQNYENVINCITPCLGEFMYDLDNDGCVYTIGREYVQTAQQLKQEFGEDRLSEGTRNLLRNGSNFSQEVIVNHLIEKNEGDFGTVPKSFPFREVYWEAGSGRKEYLRTKGYYSWPGCTSRWDVTSNDPYGRAPGMDALGGIKQLQIETRRKAENVDKLNRPPLLADIALQGNPMALLPGGVTYVAGLAAGRDGAKPVYTVMNAIGEMRQDIQEIQQRIKITFHNDLFTGITDLQTVRTATEIDARREEKLVLLGPVLEHIIKETLNNAIDRTWDIMSRGGLLPPAPAVLRGKSTFVHTDYVSMLAMAQRGIATAAIEKLWAFAGGIAGIKPTVINKLDEYATIDVYADALGADPKIVRGAKEVAAIEDAQEQERRADKMAGMVQPGADAAKTLSETPVGGAASALDLILGTSQGPQQ